jgi:hypothetical protein
MLNQIFDEKCKKTESSNQPLFSMEYNFDEIKRKHDSAIEEWRRMSQESRSSYSSELDFLRARPEGY